MSLTTNIFDLYEQYTVMENTKQYLPFTYIFYYFKRAKFDKAISNLTEQASIFELSEYVLSVLNSNNVKWDGLETRDRCLITTLSNHYTVVYYATSNKFEISSDEILFEVEADKRVSSYKSTVWTIVIELLRLKYKKFIRYFFEYLYDRR